MIYTHHSQGQKWGLGFIWLGLVVCAIASSLPFWYKVEFDFSSDILISVDVKYELNAGVWMYCYQYKAKAPLGVATVSSTECRGNYYSLEFNGNQFDIKDNSIIYIVRGAVVTSCIMAALCAFLSCCRSSPARTMAPGLVMLVSASLAFTALVLMATKREDILHIPDDLFHIDVDWALGIYAFGAMLWGLAAIVLIPATPSENNRVSGTVIGPDTTRVNVVTNHHITAPQQMAPLTGPPQYFGDQPNGTPGYGHLPFGTPQSSTPTSEALQYETRLIGNTQPIVAEYGVAEDVPSPNRIAKY